MIISIDLPKPRFPCRGLKAALVLGLSDVAAGPIRSPIANFIGAFAPNKMNSAMLISVVFGLDRFFFSKYLCRNVWNRTFINLGGSAQTYIGVHEGLAIECATWTYCFRECVSDQFVFSTSQGVVWAVLRYNAKPSGYPKSCVSTHIRLVSRLRSDHISSFSAAPEVLTVQGYRLWWDFATEFIFDIHFCLRPRRCSLVLLFLDERQRMI